MWTNPIVGQKVLFPHEVIENERIRKNSMFSVWSTKFKVIFSSLKKVSNLLSLSSILQNQGYINRH